MDGVMVILSLFAVVTGVGFLFASMLRLISPSASFKEAIIHSLTEAAQVKSKSH